MSAELPGWAHIVSAAEALRCSPLDLAYLPAEDRAVWLTVAGTWGQFKSWREERAAREAERR